MLLCGPFPLTGLVEELQRPFRALPGRPRQPQLRGLALGTACVLGAGVAGLAAARVLADHAHRVVIIEPDYPDAGLRGATRPGVPHGAQLHLLLPGGRAQLDRFFPGVVAQGLAEGAVLCRPERTATYVDDVEQIATPNAEFVSSSRPFLESLIRRRVLALPNVKLVQERVTGLGYARDAVESVRYAVGGDQVVAAADFVVDATGRGSRLSDWLEQGGWPRPEAERFPVDIRYVSGRFTRSADWDGPLSGISRYSPHSPKDSAGEAVCAIENGNPSRSPERVTGSVVDVRGRPVFVREVRRDSSNPRPSAPCVRGAGGS